VNSRQRYAAKLAEMPVDELLAAHKKASAEYHSARERGDCVFEAVLWFDLVQVCDEVDRRKFSAR
jgi:hypothetical protein